MAISPPLIDAHGRVIRRWPGATLVCAASGPSLTAAALALVRAHGCPLIVVNDAYRLAPWADVLYACDAKWWAWHHGAPLFSPGAKVALAPQSRAWPGVIVLKHTGREGLETDPSGLRSGFNSGYQAINLAIHLGAARIVLLGYDMHGDHFFGQHRDGSRPPFSACLKAFASLPAALAPLGVEVINATPGSALRVFPLMPLAEVLRCAA